MSEKMSFEEALESVDDMVKKFSVLRKDEILEGLSQEDLYAELRIVVWKSWMKWRPDGGCSFSTYAYTALERGRKTVLRYYRTKRRGYGVPCLPLDRPVNKDDENTAVLSQCVSNKQTDVCEQIYWKGITPIISHCIDNLGESKAQKIIKLYLKGFNQDEISQKVNCAQSLISYYLKIFRTKLRTELVQNGYTKYGSKYDAYIIKEE